MIQVDDSPVFSYENTDHSSEAAAKVYKMYWSSEEPIWRVVSSSGVLLAATCGWELYCNNNSIEPLAASVQLVATGGGSERSVAEQHSSRVEKKTCAILDFTRLVYVCVKFT